MTEYDNTNRGAAFTPCPDQKLILQGKLNVEGNDGQVALIMAESKDGSKRIEVFQKVGVLFTNKGKADNAKAPDYSGPLDHNGKELRIAAWREMKGENAYMSLTVSENLKPTDAPVPQDNKEVAYDMDDKIPF